MAERKPISTRRRFEIFKRDNFTCAYCGSCPPKVVLHVDHITPVSKGGTNDSDNLVTSCDTCNMGKSNIPLTGIPESLKEKAARIKEAEKQLKAFRKVIQEQKARIESDCWQVVNELYDYQMESFSRKRLGSIARFIDMVGMDECLRAANIASYQVDGVEKRFRYFCGICWKTVRGEGF